MTRPTRIAIIGGGWAGCAALVTAAKLGHAVDLYEAARTLGGRARSTQLEDKTLDNGQHILLGAYTATLDTIKLAGCDPENLFLRLPLSLVFPGAFALRAPTWLPAPLHLLAALCTAQGLTWADRWSAIRFMATQQLRNFKLPEDLSVARLLADARQTSNTLRYLWEPLCIAALNTPLEAASAQVFLNVLRDALTQTRAASDLLIPRTDLTTSFPALAQAFGEAHGARVFTGCAVKSLIQSGSSFSLQTQSNANTPNDAYDHVILAVAPQHASALLEPFASTATVRAQLAAFAYESITTCYLQYDAAAKLPAPMIGFAVSPTTLSQWAFDRGALDGHAGLIAVVVSASGNALDLGQAEIARRIATEVSVHLGQAQGTAPLWTRVITEKRATFRCAPNLSRPTTHSGVSGLWLAGDYVESPYPATLEAAVRSGVAAAQAAKT